MVLLLTLWHFGTPSLRHGRYKFVAGKEAKMAGVKTLSSLVDTVRVANNKRWPVPLGHFVPRVKATQDSIGKEIARADTVRGHSISIPVVAAPTAAAAQTYVNMPAPGPLAEEPATIAAFLQVHGRPSLRGLCSAAHSLSHSPSHSPSHSTQSRGRPSLLGLCLGFAQCRAAPLSHVGRSDCRT